MKKKNNSVIGIQTLFLLLNSLCIHVPVTSIILIKNKTTIMYGVNKLQTRKLTQWNSFQQTDRQTNIWANHQIINDEFPEIWNITRVSFESSQDMMSIFTMTLNCIRSYCDIVCSYDDKLFCVRRLIKTSCKALLTTSWCHVKSV